MDKIAGYPDSFEIARVVEGANASLELDGTTARLFVRQVVVVDDDRCRTESAAFSLQADASRKSWLIRWDYVRDPPESEYAYPRAHVDVNATFADGMPVGRLHVPTGPGSTNAGGEPGRAGVQDHGRGGAGRGACLFARDMCACRPYGSPMRAPQCEGVGRLNC